MSKFIDITGLKFGRLTVLEYIPNYVTKNGKISPRWKCICECQLKSPEEERKYTYARSIDLRNSNIVSCGCYHQELRHTIKIKNPAIRVEDLMGQKFGRLTVKQRGENTLSGQAQWWCECDCGNPNLVLIRARNLKTGNTKSCGCIHKEVVSKMCKEKFRPNNYDLETYDYGIGYTDNCDSNGIDYFYFDKEDYNKIKNYHWAFGVKDGVQANFGKTTILMHRLVMNIIDKDIQVDHIKHKRYDNRKSQLRIVNNSQNGMNNGLQINNKTGCTGVYFDERNQKYMAYISENNKQHYLGYHENYEDAVKARKEAEELLHGEYSYENSMSANLEESSENNNE